MQESEFIEEIGRALFCESIDLSIDKDCTNSERSTSSLGDTSISCILAKSAMASVLVYEVKADLFVSDICVIVILLTVVVLLIVPVLVNFGISDHLVFVQADPVQYKVSTPVLKLSEFDGIVIL